MGGSVIPGGIGLDEARHDEAPQPPAPAGAIMSGIAPEPGPAPPPEAAVSPDAAVAAGVPASPPGDGGQTVVLVSPDEGVALDRSWATGGTIAVTLVRDGADLRIDYGNPGSVLLAGFFAAAGGPALAVGDGAPVPAARIADLFAAGERELAEPGALSGTAPTFRSVVALPVGERIGIIALLGPDGLTFGLPEADGAEPAPDDAPLPPLPPLPPEPPPAVTPITDARPPSEPFPEPPLPAEPEPASTPTDVATPAEEPGPPPEAGEDSAAAEPPPPPSAEPDADRAGLPEPEPDAAIGGEPEPWPESNVPPDMAAESAEDYELEPGPEPQAGPEPELEFEPEAGDMPSAPAADRAGEAAPAAAAYAVRCDTALDVPAGDGVLRGQPERRLVSVGAMNTDRDGSVVLNTDGSFCYMPPPGFGGADAFEYSFVDADGTLDTAVVAVAVEPPEASQVPDSAADAAPDNVIVLPTAVARLPATVLANAGAGGPGEVGPPTRPAVEDADDADALPPDRPDGPDWGGAAAPAADEPGWTEVGTLPADASDLAAGAAPPPEAPGWPDIDISAADDLEAVEAVPDEAGAGMPPPDEEGEPAAEAMPPGRPAISAGDPDAPDFVFGLDDLDSAPDDAAAATGEPTGAGGWSGTRWEDDGEAAAIEEPPAGAAQAAPPEDDVLPTVLPAVAAMPRDVLFAIDLAALQGPDAAAPAVAGSAGTAAVAAVKRCVAALALGWARDQTRVRVQPFAGDGTAMAATFSDLSDPERVVRFLDDLSPAMGAGAEALPDAVARWLDAPGTGKRPRRALVLVAAPQAAGLADRLAPLFPGQAAAEAVVLALGAQAQAGADDRAGPVRVVAAPSAAALLRGMAAALAPSGGDDR